jgi:hypothetical protein
LSQDQTRESPSKTKKKLEPRLKVPFEIKNWTVLVYTNDHCWIDIINRNKPYSLFEWFLRFITMILKKIKKSKDRFWCITIVLKNWGKIKIKIKIKVTHKIASPLSVLSCKLVVHYSEFFFKKPKWQFFDSEIFKQWELGVLYNFKK